MTPALNQLHKIALDGRLGKMTAKERNQIVRRAAEMRHAEQQRTGRNAGPIKAWIRRLVEQETGLEVRSEADGRPVVVSVDGPAVRVRLADGTVVRAAFAFGLRPVVGDRVCLRGGRATEIAPRRTCLSRPDPSQAGASLPMAANVDRVVVVVSVGSPRFHPRLIDRALVAIEASGADPAICLNKIDSVSHRCRTCGVLHSNRVAADDNRMLLLSIAARTRAQPAFPLDRCDPDDGSWR